MSEYVTVQPRVEVNIEVNDELFVNALRKSRFYWETVKPRLDLAAFLEKYMENPREFYRWFYSTRVEELTLKDILGKLNEKKLEEEKEKYLQELDKLKRRLEEKK